MAEVERGMEVGELRKLLTKSKTEPVNAAVGLDGKNAVIMLHKIKQPKAVSKDLEGKFKELKNARWGTAFVDIDNDPKLVILTLNRAASGMGAKLKKTLKGTGFSKVRIQLEDGTVAEDIGEEDEEEGEGQTQARTQEQTPEGPVANGPSEENESEAEDSKQPQPEQVAAQGPNQQNEAQDEKESQAEQTEQGDMAALTQRLTALVKTMMVVIKNEPTRAADLKGFATQAQAAIKSGDQQAATLAMDGLQQSLMHGRGTDANATPEATNDSSPQATNDSTPQAKTAAAAPPNAAVLQKSRTAWVAARQRIEGDIGKLHDAMSKHYEGHGFSADLDKVFQAKVEPILTSLDQSLASKLDEVGKNTDPAQHQKLVGEAQQIIGRYESFLASEPLIPQLDKNPFVPLQIQKTLTATLEALKKVVR